MSRRRHWHNERPNCVLCLEKFELFQLFYYLTTSSFDRTIIFIIFFVGQSRRPNYENIGSYGRLGSISLTCLLEAFACADPESVKRLTTWPSFLRIWDLRAQKIRVKCRWHWPLMPGMTRAQFHQHFLAAFTPKDPKKRKKDWMLDCIFCAFGIWVCKSFS